MTADPSGAGGVLIGRSYTRARRYQWVIGTLPSGTGSRVRLPFGPYTLTQIGVALVTLVLVVQTRSWWSGGGLMAILVAISLPIAAALAIRRARIEGRDPLKAAVGLARHLSAPTRGRLRHRPLPQPAPVLLRGQLLLLHHPTPSRPGPDAVDAADPAGPIPATFAAEPAAGAGTSQPSLPARPLVTERPHAPPAPTAGPRPSGAASGAARSGSLQALLAAEIAHTENRTA